MRAQRIILAVAFLATYPFWSIPARSQDSNANAVGLGIASSRSSSQSGAVAISGQGGRGGQGGQGGSSNSALTINNSGQPSNQSITSDGRLTTSGRLDQNTNLSGGTFSTQRNTGTQRIISAPSTFAPGLAAAGVETCLGSVSAGASFPGGGVSFGTTTKDTGCDARLDARTLWSMNLKRAAVMRLCQKPEVAQAMPEVCPQPVDPNASAGYPGPVARAATLEPSPYSGGPTMVIEKRTGRERPCNNYSNGRCLQWGR